MTKYLTTLAVLLLAGAALGDTVTLKDGRKIDGLLLPRNGAAVVSIKLDDGRTVTVQPDEIRSVVLNSAPTPGEQADAAWGALDGQTKKSENLDQLIGAHEKYLQSFPDGPKASDVRAALATYQKMKADEWVRFRGTWMPKAQAAALVRQASADAELARDFLTTGKMREAFDKAKVALASDNQNMIALGVAGISKYRQNDIPTAREFFTRAIAVRDTDPLGRNNLGVICFVQGRQAEGLIHFKTALIGALDNRQILDNITIALAKYAGAKDIPAYKDLAAIYNQAETKLAAPMAEKNLYRYAYTWVTKEQRDALASKVQAVRTRMDQMEGQYTASIAALTGVEQDLKDTNAAYDWAFSDYNYYESVILAYGSGVVVNRAGTAAGGVAGGRGVSVVYADPSWYLQRDNAWAQLMALSQRRSQLDQQRTGLLVAIRQLRLDAARVKADWTKVQPRPESGTLRMLEPGDVEKPPAPAPYDKGA